MKYSLLYILSLFTFHYSLAQKQELRYVFSLDTTTQSLKVEMQLIGTDSGKTYLKFPDKFANEEKLYRAIKSVGVLTNGAMLQVTEDSSLWYISHKPKQKIKIAYTLHQDWEGAFYHPRNYRAVIQKQYMQLTANALLVIPKDDSTKSVKVHLDWSNLPKEWKVSNSLHSISRKHTSTLTLEKLQNTFYVAGDFRVHRTEINGKELFVAIRGDHWKFQDKEMVDKIIATITMQRQFWNDHSEEYYFVSLIPFDGDGSYNGTSLHQSFMLGMSEDYTIGTSVLSLLSHEYFHRWNGNLINLTGTEYENKWFSEGFTEYYSYKLLYTAKMIPFEEYLKSINQHIADYYLSAVRNEDNTTLAKYYWSTRDYNHLPYKKGFVYALYLDQFIQSTSKGLYSLDNIMLDMVKAKNQNQDLSNNLFLKLVQQYAGKDISQWQNDFIINGKTIPVLKEGFADKTIYELKTLGAFDVGFDLDASWKSKEIMQIKENSEAWKAGLRNGQKIKGFSISYDDINKPAEISIEENGTIKKITYLPMSATKVEVPQFILR